MRIVFSAVFQQKGRTRPSVLAGLRFGVLNLSDTQTHSHYRLECLHPASVQLWKTADSCRVQFFCSVFARLARLARFDVDAGAGNR